jgi:CRP-like cAMP-binding protein
MAERNALLATIGDAERSRIVSLGKVVHLGLKESLYEVGRPIEHVYFPQSGVLSLVTVLENGRVVEVATVGKEGMVGLPVFLGARSIPGRAFSQIPGESLRLDSEVFRKQMRLHGALHDLLHRYAQALFNQITWSVACLREHSIEQRCARWLLMTRDRVGGNQFPITQEFLAMMLGVRRASVSEVASRLQRNGLINYVRGMMTIVNRRRLEKKSCECYRIVRDEYRRLVGRSG